MRKEPKNKKQEKELKEKLLAEKIYQIGLSASKDPSFLKKMKEDKDFVEKLLGANKQLEETKKYHKLAEKVGVKEEDFSNSNIKLQIELQSKLNGIINKENIDELVNLSGNHNDIVEEN